MTLLFQLLILHEIDAAHLCSTMAYNSSFDPDHLRSLAPATFEPSPLSYLSTPGGHSPHESAVCSKEDCLREVALSHGPGAPTVDYILPDLDCSSSARHKDLVITLFLVHLASVAPVCLGGRQSSNASCEPIGHLGVISSIGLTYSRFADTQRSHRTDRGSFVTDRGRFDS